MTANFNKDTLNAAETLLAEINSNYADILQEALTPEHIYYLRRIGADLLDVKHYNLTCAAIDAIKNFTPEFNHWIADGLSAMFAHWTDDKVDRMLEQDCTLLMVAKNFLDAWSKTSANQ